MQYILKHLKLYYNSVVLQFVFGGVRESVEERALLYLRIVQERPRNLIAISCRSP